MSVPELLETFMLLCFSASWYGSIRQVWRTHDARGMHKPFALLVCIGCLMGLGAKVVLYAETGVLSPLVWLYAWNVIVTAAQLVLIVKLSDQVDERRILGARPMDQAAG